MELENVVWIILIRSKVYSQLNSIFPFLEDLKGFYSKKTLYLGSAWFLLKEGRRIIAISSKCYKDREFRITVMGERLFSTPSVSLPRPPTSTNAGSLNTAKNGRLA
jgi:hypothetical protein